MTFGGLREIRLVTFVLLFLSTGFVFGAQLIVTNTNDSGDGSLRSAIENANASAGADTIVFNIPQEDAGYANGVWTISLQTMLPNLDSGGIFIDGTSQTNNQGDTNPAGPEIVLNGENVSGFSTGFYISSAGNKIKGMVIINFASYGVRIVGAQAKNNYIEGNYIGVDASGSTIAFNGWAGVALESGASQNVIGGDDAASRNVISGNNNFGVSLSGDGVSQNVVKGNFIGLTADSSGALGNGWYGVYLEDGASSNIIGPANIIAYNNRDGVYITGNTTLKNTITENAIYQNGEDGIKLANGGNNQLEPPLFAGRDGAEISFTTLPNAKVEVFSDNGDEGAFYEGELVADGDGVATWSGHPAGMNITTTVTDADGNTSPFSSPIRYGAFVVTNTNDSGEGSLRWAIEGANANTGPDSIRFAIPKTDANFDGTIWHILLTASLPALTDDETIIDGFSQATNIQDTNPLGPEIFLDGSNAAGAVFGLTLTSARNIVQGIGIGNFSESGIYISGENAKENRILGNFIGAGASGAEPMPNAVHGIYLKNAGVKNYIGGKTEKARNVISGNTKSGIYIDAADSTIIQGNYIGCNIFATHALANGAHGIAMVSATEYTLIGGEEEGAANIISGNNEFGIWINGNRVKSSTVAGNFIGTDTTRTIDLGNKKFGIYVSAGTTNNTLGPNNVVMFNKKSGIGVIGSSTVGNRITRNSISKNNLLGIALSNGGNGGIAAPSGLSATATEVSGQAPPNSLVEIFSDNSDEGAIYEGSTTADASGNFTWTGEAQGPSITATATDAQGNTSEFSLPFRKIPFMVTTTRDSVDGCLRYAIEGANRSPDPVSIAFNIPPDDPNYDATTGVWIIRPGSALPPLSGGDIEIDGASQTRNQGDTNPNGPEIYIDGSRAGNKAKGFEVRSANNWIHDIAIANFSLNCIVIISEEAKNNRITGCLIGLSPDGAEAAENNGQNGIVITVNADSNTIGGLSPEERNYIGGMKFNGIVFTGNNVRDNVIVGNYIGTDVTGMKAIPNHYFGIRIDKGAKHNRIGGFTPAARNVCSGNGKAGIRLEGVGTDSNLVVGNLCGLMPTGTDTLGNGEAGISLANKVKYNVIGGLEAGAANIIAGNHSSGIQVFGGSNENKVIGNIVGLGVNGEKVFGNGHHGIYVLGSSYNEIGPGNIIGGNGIYGGTWACGIMLDGEQGQNNKVFENYVGLRPDGSAAGNVNHGIGVQKGASNNQIGPGNMIAYNGGDGIRLMRERTLYNKITKNSIFANTGKGIENMQGANLEVQPPIVYFAKNGWVAGEAIQYSTVEIFMGPDDEGKTFIGETTADAEGKFKLQVDAPDSFVTATTTDIFGNTSEFSAVIITSVETEKETLPTSFALRQNYPNPFNPSTTITFALPRAEHVTLDIYNIRGQLVTRLIDKKMKAGVHQVTWNAASAETGQPLPSGTYIYRIKAGKYSDYKKLLLLK